MVPKLFRVLGAPHLAQWLLVRTLRRLDQYTVMDERGWHQQLEAAQLEVIHVGYYLSTRQAFWFRLLTLHPLWLVAIVKMLRISRLAQRAARLQERLFRPLFVAREDMSQADKRAQASTLLIIARKRATNIA